MKLRDFNPRTIFWILALIILVGGIFTLNYDYHFQVFGIHKALSFAHVGAIISGILSLVSFGYGSVKENLPPALIKILHLLTSIGLLVLIIYNGISLNLLDTVFPTLEASAVELKEWETQNQTWSGFMHNAQKAFFGFTLLQITMIVYLFYCVRKSIPKVQAL